MAITYIKLFDSNHVNNAAVETLYTVPSTPSTTLLRNGRVRFTNVTGGAVMLDVYAVANAGSPSIANALYYQYSLAANAIIDVDIPVLGAGGSIQAQAGAANSITAHALDGVLFS